MGRALERIPGVVPHARRAPIRAIAPVGDGALGAVVHVAVRVDELRLARQRFVQPMRVDAVQRLALLASCRLVAVMAECVLLLQGRSSRLIAVSTGGVLTAVAVTGHDFRCCGVLRLFWGVVTVSVPTH